MRAACVPAGTSDTPPGSCGSKPRQTFSFFFVPPLAIAGCADMLTMGTAGCGRRGLVACLLAATSVAASAVAAAEGSVAGPRQGSFRWGLGTPGAARSQLSSLSAREPAAFDDMQLRLRGGGAVELTGAVPGPLEWMLGLLAVCCLSTPFANPPPLYVDLGPSSQRSRTSCTLRVELTRVSSSSKNQRRGLVRPAL